jgi:hypothetical protein
MRHLAPKATFCDVYLPWEREYEEPEVMEEATKDNHNSENFEENEREHTGKDLKTS